MEYESFCFLLFPLSNNIFVKSVYLLVVLTRAVSLREDGGVAEVVLQRQVSDAVQAPVGGEAQSERVAGSKHRHQPRRAAVAAARAAARVNFGGVGQRDLHRCLRRHQSRECRH